MIETRTRKGMILTEPSILGGIESPIRKSCTKIIQQAVLNLVN